MFKKIVLFMMSAVIIPSASALYLPGEVQPDRYTYYLTPEFAQQLKVENDKREGKWRLGLPAGQLVSETNWQKAANKPAPKAITCISSIYFNEGAQANWLKIGCVDNQGLEYSASRQWPSKSIATKVCKVGEPQCGSFLVLESDT
ncbi:TPA: hypothetical protein SMV14_001948 [Proteus mirabilis]|nr:hypothetical protein [Proteus mirabilis]